METPLTRSGDIDLGRHCVCLKGSTMKDSADAVIRNYFASFVKSDVDELTSFFTDDAVYVDGPRGVHRGIDAIRAEFEAIVQIVPSTTVDIKALVANGGTVMVERVDNFEIGGKPFDLEVVGVFDVDDNGRITRWHDYYDLRSSEERIAAGLAAQSR